MKILRFVLFFTFLFLLNISPLRAEISLLKGLELPKEKIPKGCGAEEIPPDMAAGKKLTNPGRITDPELIQKLDPDRLLEPSKVKEMFFSVYQYQGTKTEVGLFGYEFVSEAAAKEYQQRLQSKISKDAVNSKVWQVSGSVVFLWQDSGETSPCYTAFLQHAQKVMKGN